MRYFWIHLIFPHFRVLLLSPIFIGDTWTKQKKKILPKSKFFLRIPGLSKKFIYFNDDIFLGSQIYPDDFYSPTRGYLIYLAWPLPMCSFDCPWIYVGDGQCDHNCDNFNCQYDGGDCDPKAKVSYFYTDVMKSIILLFFKFQIRKLIKSSTY